MATRRRGWRLNLSRPARDALTFLGGLAIMGWETIVERSDRPYLLGAALAMLGLPYVRFLDRRDRELADSDDSDTPPAATPERSSGSPSAEP